MTAPAGRTDALADLLGTIEVQRIGCELAGSPLYAEVLQVVADDVAAGGPCADVLAPVAGLPFGDAVLLRFLGGVHRLVLDGHEPALAAQFPSAGGSPDHALGPLFVAAVDRHRERLAASLTAGVQTNEVGRSVALLGGYLEVAKLGLPLRVLEVGASAGLNLRVDRYRYEQGGAAFGPEDSPLRFVDPWAGPVPDLTVPLQVAERRGCDVDPIDPATHEGRQRLRAFVWPDQPDRRARLDAALVVARDLPVPVDRDGAVPWLRRRLAEPAPGRATVVAHSIMFQYLSPDDRRAFLTLVEEAGGRATPEAPVAWLRMEPGGDRAETRLTVWPGGTPRSLATSPYHGLPVAWTG